MATREESTASKPRKARAAKWTGETELLLAEWGDRAAAAKCAHYELVDRYRKRYTRLGVPVVVLSSIVGTSLFATLSEEAISEKFRFGAASISVLAAVFAALQTFLRYGERAERHMVAADWYAGLHRRARQVLALPPDDRPDMVKCLDEMRRELARVGQQSPEIGEKHWHTTAQKFGIDDRSPRRTSLLSAVEGGEAVLEDSLGKRDESV